MMKLITTSWDDGHPLDFRIAELLDKYNLKGTFYIPASNSEHEVMNAQEIITLSKNFEIGGHTLHHTPINKVSQELFTKEIKGCYLWLTNLLGKEPESFCFPLGKYNQEAIDFSIKTGFHIIRTTELLNPSMHGLQTVIPTTLQVYPHSPITYSKHLLKRYKLTSLLLFLKSKRKRDLLYNLDYYLNHIQTYGGCFHLWGHSWEIEQYNLWNTLEQLFQNMSNLSGFTYLENRDLYNYLHTSVEKETSISTT